MVIGLLHLFDPSPDVLFDRSFGVLFDYPFFLMLSIFLLLAIPLLLIPLKFPKAPQWNIAELWIIVVLMVLRALGVFLLPLSSEELPVVILALLGIVSLSLGRAIIWTKYFKKPVRGRR